MRDHYEIVNPGVLKNIAGCWACHDDRTVITCTGVRWGFPICIIVIVGEVKRTLAIHWRTIVHTWLLQQVEFFEYGEITPSPDSSSLSLISSFYLIIWTLLYTTDTALSSHPPL